MDGETYLGDGLYASHDGSQLVLRAPRADGDHVVYLEADIWVALLNYMKAPRQPQADKAHTLDDGLEF